MDRPALRKLLSEALRGDSDVEAFCCDYFPAVHERFSLGMDRQQKLTMLLTVAEAEHILDALRKAYPGAVLAPVPRPERRVEAELSAAPGSPAIPEVLAMPETPPKPVRPSALASSALPENSSQRVDLSAPMVSGLPVRSRWMAPAIAAAVALLVGVVGATSWIRGNSPALPLHFVSLPGGRFQMGSPAGESGHSPDEDQHWAEVGSFEISIHEVTQKQWIAVMGTRPFNCSSGCGDDLPAQNVSWFDAAKFMNALTDRENNARPDGDKRTRCYDDNWTWNRTCTGYRLPTEAEWEYAARAGSATAYSFGDNIEDLLSFGNGGVIKMQLKDGMMQEVLDGTDKYKYLAPVGSFQANQWGLFDMHGNVSEWVWDWYGPYPAVPPPGYAGPNTGDVRVLRGGSFTGALRSARRDRDWPGTARWSYGIRCARGFLPPSNRTFAP